LGRMLTRLKAKYKVRSVKFEVSSNLLCTSDFEV
jgi:hypothetical protein